MYVHTQIHRRLLPPPDIRHKALSPLSLARLDHKVQPYSRVQPRPPAVWKTVPADEGWTGSSSATSVAPLPLMHQNNKAGNCLPQAQSTQLCQVLQCQTQGLLDKQEQV